VSTDPADTRPTPSGLAGRLRALREATRPRISQTAAAAAIDTSQNRLSRIEAGRHVPTPAEARALGRLYGADRAQQVQLAAWAKALTPARVDARMIVRRRGGRAEFQRRIRDAEQGARLVRSFQPGMVVGVAQTRAYATVVFGGREDAVEARLERHRQLLDDPTRHWILVQPVGALLWNLGGATVMAEQIDQLVEVSHLAHVDLRIITAAQPMTVAVTHGFHLYDHGAVVVGLKTGTTISGDPRDIEQYSDLHDHLAAGAVGGDQARDVLAGLAHDYRAPLNLDPWTNCAGDRRVNEESAL